jgi:acetylornithine deacetylase/succinyl-diaminopimelate desuccinylase-like protein
VNAAVKLLKTLNAIQALDSGQPQGTTVVVTQLQAGKAVNQIPEDARATIDIRFMTIDDYESTRQQILSIAQAHDCTVDTLVFIEPIQHQLDHPLMRQYITVAEAVQGKPLTSTLSFGAADGRHFVARGTPAITIRPFGGGQHSSEEWISEQSLETFYQVLKRYVQTVASLT